jgi:hypothetical protein
MEEKIHPYISVFENDQKQFFRCVRVLEDGTLRNENIGTPNLTTIGLSKTRHSYAFTRNIVVFFRFKAKAAMCIDGGAQRQFMEDSREFSNDDERAKKK